MGSFQLPEGSEGHRLLQLILARFHSAEKRHRRYRTKWDHLYSLHRSHKSWRDAYRASGDKKDVVQDAQREFGAELFIPRAFETVAAILPRVAQSRPAMDIRPRGDTPEQNAENMKLVMEGQQEQIAYELKVQETLESGLIYGLGVEKHYWKTDLHPMPVIETGMRGFPMAGERLCGHDDPWCETVDIFDFFWDPFAASLEEARWVIHRTWRDTDYVVKMMVGKWNNPFGVPPSGMAEGGGSQHYTTVHAQRLNEAGVEVASADERRHEVWEYHDGRQVVTILNREFPVQVGAKPSPTHGVAGTFVAYRPQLQGIKELPGIGVIEPIEHLQHEENTFRSLRIDNARFVVNRAFAYQDGAIDPDDFKVGPGVAIPFRYGDPREQLFPLPVQDLPSSSYQEMEALRNDIDRVTGLSDTTLGASSAGETATGVQMVQQAANVRIANMAHRLIVELVEKGGRIWLALNQWKIRENREVQVPWTPEDGGPERKWAQRVIPPEALAGEMFVSVEGTLAPENEAADIQRAQIMMQLFGGNPQIDQALLYAKALKLLGEKRPDAWVLPAGPRGESLMMALEQMGVSQEQIGQIAEMAMQLEEQEKMQGEQAA